MCYRKVGALELEKRVELLRKIKFHLTLIDLQEAYIGEERKTLWKVAKGRMTFTDTNYFHGDEKLCLRHNAH